MLLSFEVLIGNFYFLDLFNHFATKIKELKEDCKTIDFYGLDNLSQMNGGFI